MLVLQYLLTIVSCESLNTISIQVLKCDHASTASDMWSVGVLLYTLLSGGILPFGDNSKSRVSVMRNISR